MNSSAEPDSPMSVHRVVVAGGGIGGLTLARALTARGLSVRVLEQAPGPSEVGAGITLWRNALNVLESLDLGDAVEAVAHAPESGGIGLPDGRMLSVVHLEDIPGAIRRPLLLTFHRRDLQRVLLDALPEGTVEFGCRVVGYREMPNAVACEIEGRREIEADLLVGADGISSRVRAQLLGQEPPRYAGYTCFRGVTYAAPAARHTSGEFWGAGDRFGVVPIAGDRMYWFAVISAPPRQQVDDAKAYLLRRFERYAAHLPDLIERTAADAIVHNDIIDRPPISGWSGSRVTLLGDAVHATTPNLGQGAAMAIESAAILARALSKPTGLADALSSYEAARQRRTTHVTRTSWRVGRMAHIRSAPGRAIRNLALRVTPPAVQLRSLVGLLGYDASTAELGER
jgi:2-polyprenyl-6-methoxyphenol hydroxylase-like FAD-dependent oxidoreductase